MEIAMIGCRRRPVFPAAAFLAAVLVVVPVSGVAASKRDAATEESPKAAKSPDAEKEKRGALTVNVLLIDPDKKNKRLPAADALVRIEGSDDGYTTDDKGRAELSEIPTGKVTLHIKVIGAALCRLRDIPVTEGDQRVSVLIEKAPEGKCWRE